MRIQNAEVRRQQAVRWLRMGIAALVAALLVISPLRAGETKAKPVAVPFELLKTQHMVVEVKINGKGPYHLIFDTGAPINLINNKVAKEAGVLPKDFKQPFFTFFGSVGQHKIKSLEIGGLKSENLSVMVMDHPTVEAIAKFFGPIEGIVGMSFFGRYRMTLDYQTKTMSFVPVNYEPPDMMEQMMKMLTFARKTEKTFVGSPGLLGAKVVREGEEEAGVSVKEVLAGSPAARAGLKQGDRILTVDGRWTDTVGDFYAAMSRLKVGEPAPAVIRRDGKEQKIQVQLVPGI